MGKVCVWKIEENEYEESSFIPFVNFIKLKIINFKLLPYHPLEGVLETYCPVHRG